MQQHNQAKSLHLNVRIASALAALLLTACGKPGGLAPEEPVGSSGGSGNSSSGSSGSSGSSNNDSAGAGGNSFADNAPDVEDPTQTLPDEDLPDGPPEGCLEAYQGTALELTLSTQVPAARIEARDGELFVNDTACTTEIGAPIDIATIETLHLVGSTISDTVELDLDSGDWTTLLSTEGSILLELGGGNDTAALTMGAGDDLIRHAEHDGAVVLDLTGDGSVNLTTSDTERLSLNLGAGDDVVEDLWSWMQLELEEDDERFEGRWTELGARLLAFGGEGNDQITGGSGDDWIGGGPGDDILSGMDGSDQFTGAPEMDGRDIINGGTSFDLISYAQRTQDLTLTMCLSEALAGCAPEVCTCEGSGEVDENDLLVNLEGIRAGSGDDVIHGSDAPESLIGGAGDDQIFGRAGSDVLLGQQGLDVLDGGDDEDICDLESTEEDLGCEL